LGFYKWDVIYGVTAKNKFQSNAMSTNEKSHCRICGYKADEPPWGEDGNTPLFEFCPCCGVEHGYQDATRIAVLNFRKKWLDKGMPWDDEKEKPAQWDPTSQLSHVPSAFK
jgi:hypothetical protein